MLIKADAKQLEWRVAAYLSQDTTALAEILDGKDIHEDNRKVLGLPSRLIAKTFLFRIIYGGTQFAFAKDPEFTSVSTDARFWERLIQEFYGKYRGLAQWHEDLVDGAISNGFVTIPSGRTFRYAPYRDKRGELKWPRTTILNYPVQGFSADLMTIARISAFKRIKSLGFQEVMLVNTVHDDIEIDCDNSPELIEVIGKTMMRVFEDIPRNFNKLYGIDFNVPLSGEVSVGQNLKEMIDFQEWLDKGRKI
jgi:DNA polymerase-1